MGKKKNVDPSQVPFMKSELVAAAFEILMEAYIGTIIRSVEYDSSPNNQNNGVSDNIGKNIALQVNGVRELELFKKTIELLELSALFNICIKSIEQNGEGSLKAIIDNFSVNEPGYCSYIWFKDNESFSKYISCNDSYKILEELKNAKPVFEYVEEEQDAD